MLHLRWVLDLPKHKLTCQVNSELAYEALRGGRSGFIKSYKGETSTVTYDDWRAEVEWIAETYPELPRAKSGPVDDADFEDIKLKNYWHTLNFGRVYYYGISENNYVLDRMGREVRLQSNSDEWLFTMVMIVPSFGIIETADGKDFYVRLENNSGAGVATHYNQMPCCVFPDNPGLRLLTEEEIQLYKVREQMQLVTLKNKLEDTTKHFVLF